MHRKGIRTREELARAIGESPATIRRNVEEDWDGEPTAPIVAVVCRKLNVSHHKIIRDPRHQ